MWVIEGNPDTDHLPPGGYDGTWHKYWLVSAGRRTFTIVKISRHAEMKASNSMTTRSLEAVDSDGRSEVERHLEDRVPPRAIEVGTISNPVVTPRKVG